MKISTRGNGVINYDPSHVGRKKSWWTSVHQKKFRRLTFTPVQNQHCAADAMTRYPRARCRC